MQPQQTEIEMLCLFLSFLSSLLFVLERWALWRVSLQMLQKLGWKIQRISSNDRQIEPTELKRDLGNYSNSFDEWHLFDNGSYLLILAYPLLNWYLLHPRQPASFTRQTRESWYAASFLSGVVMMKTDTAKQSTRMRTTVSETGQIAGISLIRNRPHHYAYRDVYSYTVYQPTQSYALHTAFGVPWDIISYCDAPFPPRGTTINWALDVPSSILFRASSSSI